MNKTFSDILADDLQLIGLRHLARRFLLRFGAESSDEAKAFYLYQRSRVWAGNITQNSAIRYLYRLTP